MAAFILVMSNIIIMLIGYIIISYRLKKRYINEEILIKIKTDISDMIQQMNEITERNVELVKTSRNELNRLVNEKQSQVTEMLLNIEKKIRLIEEKMKQLKQIAPKLLSETDADMPFDKNTTAKQTETYSYIDILNKTRSAAENKKQIEEDEKKKQKELEDKLSKMEITDKIGYLAEIGKSHAEIKKLLDVYEEEIELSLNLYKSRRHNDSM